MAGAIDLSGLKQRAQQPAAPGEGGTAAAVPGAIEVTEANFEAEVLARSGQLPVVVVLWSPRSDSSVQLSEILAGLAAQDGGTWALATVNVDTTPRVAQLFGVQAVPTVVALAGGQPLASFQGMQPPEQLRGWVDSLLNATGRQARRISRGRRARTGRPRAGRRARPPRRRRLRRREIRL